MERVLVAGATSRLGRELVGLLRARGHAVRVLVRRPLAVTDEVEVHVGDVTDPGSLRGACDGIDVVCSAVGAPVWPMPRRPETTFEAVDHQGNRALVREAASAGVRRFVYVSVFGRDEEAGLEYVAAHRRAEAAIEEAGLSAGIVRPTGMFSAFYQLAALARRGIGGVLGSGEARTNPIADEDVARICADLVRDDERLVEAGGPEVLTREEAARLCFEAVGRRPFVFHGPAAAARIGGRLLGPLNPRVADLVAFFAYVTTHDEVAPVRGERRLAEALAAWAPEGR